MANLNKIMVIGNITRDIELKYIPSGAAVCQFSVAVNRTWNNKAGEKQEETTFLDVEAWEKQAEVIAQYCKKGSSIYVEGRLKSEQWDDKATGQKRSKLKIHLEQFQFIGGKQEAGEKPQADKPKATPARQPKPTDPDLDVAPDDDQIPF